MEKLKELQNRLAEFASARDWDQYHSPKNLAMALIVEAAEMLEHFQWLSEEESQNLSIEKLDEVEEEVADIFIYLTRLATVLGIDLIAAAERKLVLNAKKYPADLVRGSAAKYTDYEK